MIEVVKHYIQLSHFQTNYLNLRDRLERSHHNPTSIDLNWYIEVAEESWHIPVVEESWNIAVVQESCPEPARYSS